MLSVAVMCVVCVVAVTVGVVWRRRRQKMQELIPDNSCLS